MKDNLKLYYWTGFRRANDSGTYKIPCWGYVEAASKKAARRMLKEENGYSPDELRLSVTNGLTDAPNDVIHTYPLINLADKATVNKIIGPCYERLDGVTSKTKLTPNGLTDKEL